MALLDNILNIGADAMAAAMTHASLHTSTPDSSGSNAASGVDRVAISWADASGGDLTLADELVFEGGTPGGDVTHVGFWSAATGGTFYGALALAGDDTFNAAGEYTVPSGTIAGASTDSNA